MARYLTTVTTPAPPEVVFDYLADFTTVAQWDPGITAAGLTSGTAGREGARYHVASRFLGRTIPLKYEALRSDPPDENAGVIVLRAETGDFVSHDTITVAPGPGTGTSVTYDARLELKGPRVLFDPVMQVLFGVIGRRADNGLRSALESLAVPA